MVPEADMETVLLNLRSFLGDSKCEKLKLKKNEKVNKERDILSFYICIIEKIKKEMV